MWILFLKQWVSLKEWSAALLSVAQGLSLSVRIHREIADNGWRALGVMNCGGMMLMMDVRQGHSREMGRWLTWHFPTLLCTCPLARTNSLILRCVRVRVVVVGIGQVDVV